MTRFAFVCQWYPPEPVEIPRNIARSLAANDHEVSVLTGVPNYPTGKVVAGHRASEVVTEQMDGVTVRRTPLYPSHDSSAVKRIANYASWAISATVFGQRLLRRADATLVYSSPATAALPAMAARGLWGTPYVLLIQDVWPDSVFASGFLPGAAGKVIHGLVDWFVRRTYAMADHVAVISPGMADLLAQRGVPRDKLSVVYNWVPEEDSPVQPVGDDGVTLASLAGVPGDARLFLYAGNHGHAQGLDSLVRAFLDDRTAPAHLVLLGDGVVKQDLVALAAGHPRVHFLDPVERGFAGRLLAEADVSVVSLASDPIFAVTLPSKVQSGLAMAKPMLVVADGDAAAVVTHAGAGAAAEPGVVADIVDAICRLTVASPSDLADMGARGLEVYRSQMARSVGAARLSDLLVRAATRRERRGGPSRVAIPERKPS